MPIQAPMQPPPNLSNMQQRYPHNMRGGFFRAPRGVPRGMYRGRGGSMQMPMHQGMFQQGHFRKPYPKVPWGPRPPHFIVEPTANGTSNQQNMGQKNAQRNGEGGNENASGDGHTVVEKFSNRRKKRRGGGGGGGGGGDDENKQPSQPAKAWNREDAEKALAFELEYRRKQTERSLVIRFPDPELDRNIVQAMHESIASVHFQSPANARYCFVQLNDDIDPDKVIAELNQVKFGNGTLIAERKSLKDEDALTPESIDPYTIYVGNLPSSITTSVIKQQFPNASRSDIGYAKKMRFTRYAFVKFATVDLAIEAFKNALNLMVSSRSVILKFKRHNGAVAPPGERSAPLTPEQKAAKMEKLKLKAEKEKEKKEKEKEKKEKEKEKEKIKAEKDEDDNEVEEEDDEVSEDDVEEEDDDDDDDDVDDGEEDDGEEDDDDDDDDDDDELVNADDDDDDDDDEDNNLEETYESDVNDDFSDMFYKLDGDIDNLNFNNSEYY